MCYTTPTIRPGRSPHMPTRTEPTQERSVPNLRASVPSVDKPRPRGGRRPGAGAPKGNLNGLKHGLYSKQMAALGVAFSSHPKLQEALLALAKRQQKQHRKAELVAAQIF